MILNKETCDACEKPFQEGQAIEITILGVVSNVSPDGVRTSFVGAGIIKVVHPGCGEN